MPKYNFLTQVSELLEGSVKMTRFDDNRMTRAPLPALQHCLATTKRIVHRQITTIISLKLCSTGHDATTVSDVTVP